MTTIMPESEKVRKAVRWISEETSDAKKPSALVPEASVRFNLSPKETEALQRFLADNKDEAAGGAI